MKDNKRYLWGVLAGLAVILMLLSGCAAPRQIYAEYTVIPNQIRDITTIEDMRIEVIQANVKGDYLGHGEASVYQERLESYLKERLASLIYSGGRYRIKGDIYRDKNGEDLLYSEIKGLFGEKVKSVIPRKEAVIKISADVFIDKNSGIDKIRTELYHTPYVQKRNKKGVPYSEPNYDAQTKTVEVTPVPYISIDAKGDMNVEIFDKNGNKVYAKKYTGLDYKKKIGGDGDNDAVPNFMQIMAELFNEKLVATMQDISPHKEKRLLQINEKGDKASVVLIKATAFNEAMERLETLLKNSESEFLKKKKNIETEYNEKKLKLGNSSKSTEEIKVAFLKLEQEKAAEIRKAGAFMAPDMENLAICYEIDGDLSSATEYFEKAYNLDPENISAKKAFEKLKSTQVRLDETAAK